MMRADTNDEALRKLRLDLSLEYGISIDIIKEIMEYPFKFALERMKDPDDRTKITFYPFFTFYIREIFNNPGKTFGYPEEKYRRIKADSAARWEKRKQLQDANLRKWGKLREEDGDETDTTCGTGNETRTDHRTDVLFYEQLETVSLIGYRPWVIR